MAKKSKKQRRREQTQQDKVKKPQPPKRPEKVVGVFCGVDGRFAVRPCDPSDNRIYELIEHDIALKEGHAVVGRTVGNGIEVEKDLGHIDKDPLVLSRIAMEEQNLRQFFNAAADNAAQGLTVPPLGAREDLRGLPIVTIDGPDARDFDDGVFAEPTGDGGYHLVVAIADVAWYVKPGGALDKEAAQRGNSSYFPDAVLPMLPETLSNGLCSLKPGEDRACLAFHLWINAKGELVDKRLTRGLMKSAARLTYAQVQAAKDGAPDATAAPLVQNVITPLYDAYRLLRQARDARGSLDLDAPVFKPDVDRTTGVVRGVRKEERLDSHRLIEEFMVLANIAAAKTLLEKGYPCIFRVHDLPPNEGRIQELCVTAQELGIPNLTAEDVRSITELKQLVDAAGQHPGGEHILELVIRAQARAAYDIANIGHFGLNLDDYAHFTSPIRRYADLLVHRLLIAACGLGAEEESLTEEKTLKEITTHITLTEERSDKAARRAANLHIAKYLDALPPGQRTVEARISHVNGYGLSLRLNATGADAFLPKKALPLTAQLVSENHSMIFNDIANGTVWRAGKTIEVNIAEVDRVTGRIRLSLGV